MEGVHEHAATLLRGNVLFYEHLLYRYSSPIKLVKHLIRQLFQMRMLKNFIPVFEKCVFHTVRANEDVLEHELVIAAALLAALSSQIELTESALFFGNGVCGYRRRIQLIGFRWRVWIIYLLFIRIPLVCRLLLNFGAALEIICIDNSRGLSEEAARAGVALGEWSVSLLILPEIFNL